MLKKKREGIFVGEKLSEEKFKSSEKKFTASLKKGF